MSVTVFGSINLDLTAYVQDLPAPGATIHARRHLTGLGGKGANQAVAATRLSGGRVRFVAAIGQDAFGDTLRAELGRHDVPLDDLRVFGEHPTGIALIHVDAQSQNTITVLGGANLAWPADGPEPGVFAGAGAAAFQLETPLPATLAAMRMAREAGARVILDPAPAPGDAIPAMLETAHVVTPNEVETEALIGVRPDDVETAMAAARALMERGPELAVVKLGRRGLVFAAAGGAEGFVPPFEVATVDTVAAGDSFNGALAVAFDEGMPVEAALRFAAAAGALATTRRGAAAAAPARGEVDALAARA